MAARAEARRERRERRLQRQGQPFLLSLFPTQNPPSLGWGAPLDPQPWRPAPLNDPRMVKLRDWAIYAAFLQFVSGIVGLCLAVARHTLVTDAFNVVIMVRLLFCVCCLCCYVLFSA